jgi:hypothetical protein
MIFQPEVEPANNIGARTMPFLSSCLAEAPLLGRLLYHTPFSDRTKNKARRGNPAGLGRSPEGYLFVYESCFTVQKSQVALRQYMAPSGCMACPAHEDKAGRSALFPALHRPAEGIPFEAAMIRAGPATHRLS